MVGLVLVSHSERIAEGLRELAAQMAPEVTIAVAGGDGEGGIGTSLDLVMAALEEADGGDGAVILYDLGSAQLTTETALEFVDEERRSRLVMVDAPLVEGAIALATAAAGGADLSGVVAAAPGGPATAAADSRAGQVDAERDAVLTNPLGLHARPAAAIVRALGALDARVRITNGDSGATASAASVLDIVGLGATGGTPITISAVGPDADEAVRSVAALCADGFGEIPDDADAAPDGPPSGAGDGGESDAAAGGDRTIRAVAAGPGRALGPLHHLTTIEPELPDRSPADRDEERRRLAAALSSVAAELDRRGEADDIAATHRLLVDDPGLRERADRWIDDGTVAERAWWRAVERQRDRLADMRDEVFAARAADVVDVGRRVLGALGVDTRPEPPPRGSVVLTDDLLPSDVEVLVDAGTAAAVTRSGSRTGHAAIIARGVGLPLVVGAGDALDAVDDGTTVLVDGADGSVVVGPDDDVIAAFDAWRRRERDERRRRRAEGSRPVVRPDGTRIAVAANIASVAEARAAVQAGADAVGLLRTEVLLVDGGRVADEDTQVARLAAVMDALQGRPAVVRTLDIGGDKPVAGLDLDPRVHGFLGQRGLRLCLDRPGLFRPHLRAILRVAADHPVRVLFPFVTTPEEITRAVAVVEDVRSAAEEQGVRVGAPEALGAMIEVPVAALDAGAIAATVDFLSIGTNDLLQYLFAADRTVTEVAGLVRPAHPVVLDLIRQVCDDADGVPVAVCGEVASDPEAAVRLVGAGVTELSMAPPAIPVVRERLREALDD